MDFDDATGADAVLSHGVDVRQPTGVGTVFDSVPFAGLWGPVVRFASGITFSPSLDLAAARRAVLSWLGGSFTTGTTTVLRLSDESTAVLAFDLLVVMTDVGTGTSSRRLLRNALPIRLPRHYASRLMSGAAQESLARGDGASVTFMDRGDPIAGELDILPPLGLPDVMPLLSFPTSWGSSPRCTRRWRGASRRSSHGFWERRPRPGHVVIMMRFCSELFPRRRVAGQVAAACQQRHQGRFVRSSSVGFGAPETDR